MLTLLTKSHPRMDGSGPISLVRCVFAGGQETPRKKKLEPSGTRRIIGLAPNLCRPFGTRRTESQSGHSQSHRRRFGSFSGRNDHRSGANAETAAVIEARVPSFPHASFATNDNAKSPRRGGAKQLSRFPCALACCRLCVEECFTTSLIPAFSPRRRRIVLRLAKIHATGFAGRHPQNQR